MGKKQRLSIKQLGEFGLIRRVEKLFGRRPLPGLVKGIGDDAAVVKIGHKKDIVFTTDMLVEGVHFSLKYEGFYDLGFKALAVNLSDIASMGATPRWGVVSIGLPVGISVDSVDNLAQGVANLANRYRVGIVGGDTVKSPDCLVLNLAVLGEARPGDILYRSGAVPGDALFVTGRIGEAAAGLALLQKKFTGRPGGGLETCLSRYLRPEPRLKESALIVKNKLASSMIDISDGLHISVKFLCEQSRVGATIYLDKIPLNSRLRTMNSRQALRWALSGGEDYELLFTVPRKKFRQASKFFPRGFIGEITAGKTITLVNENKEEVSYRETGYEHFKE